MAEHENLNAEARLLENAALTQFFDLTTIRDLPTLLQQALQILAETFQAEAGSVFFLTTFSQSQKMGTAPENILDHIDQWEKAVTKRLQRGTWRVLDTSLPPVSQRAYPDQNLILVNTPLLQKTRVIGSLSLVVPTAYQFTQAHQASLGRLAQGISHLGCVIAELSLTQKRYSELNLLHQTSQVLSTTLDITELLENIIQLTANALNAAAASILLVDETRQELFFRVSHSPQSYLLNQQRISLNEGVAGWVVTNNRPVIVNDVTVDSRFSRKVDVHTGFLTRSIAAVPMKFKGKVIGVLEALNKKEEDGFDDNDLQVLTSIASQAAIALENAKLYQNLREERDKIITAQENVRRSLARTLHDGAIQQLAAIGINLEYLQKQLVTEPQTAYNEIEKLQRLVQKATREARLVLFELRPILLETQGLIPALEKYVDQLNEDASFQVEADLPPLPLELDKNVAGTIFSIIQEAVNNAKRHAQGTHLKISLSLKGSFGVVQIKDNGIGFDVEEVEKGYAVGNSLGLLNMKERAALIEGNLTIYSQTDGPARGTTIILSVPLKPGTGPL